jgi:hypothetical protein
MNTMKSVYTTNHHNHHKNYIPELLLQSSSEFVYGLLVYVFGRHKRTLTCPSLFHNTCSSQVLHFQYSKYVQTSKKMCQRRVCNFVTARIELHWSVLKSPSILAYHVCFTTLR